MNTSCQQCQGVIPPQRNRRGAQARYCSDTCRDKAQNARTFGSTKMGLGLPTGTVGAIGELLVAADLLRRGYEVFRAMSQSCSCDLAVLKDGALQRVEVRTGYRIASGSLVFQKNKVDGRHDIYAVVIGGQEIVYIPDLLVHHRTPSAPASASAGPA